MSWFKRMLIGPDKCCGGDNRLGKGVTWLRCGRRCPLVRSMDRQMRERKATDG